MDEDVNDRAVESWVEDTTPVQRVHSVMETTYEPTSADKVADQARVSVDVAQSALDDLADLGVVEQSDDGYRRDPRDLAISQALDLLNRTSTEEIRSRTRELEIQSRVDATARRNLAVARLALEIDKSASIMRGERAQPKPSLENADIKSNRVTPWKWSLSRLLKRSWSRLR